MTRLPVDQEAIRALADLLNETGLTEIEIAEKDSRIRVKRAAASTLTHATGPVAVHHAPIAAAPAVTAADPAKHPGMVPSPMVGIAYLTPDPSSPPFAVEGQTVSAGQTIMLIEAMKTFNQIKAPRSGTLVQFLVDSGDPVEFGEPLAIIE